MRSMRAIIAVRRHDQQRRVKHYLADSTAASTRLSGQPRGNTARREVRRIVASRREPTRRAGRESDRRDAGGAQGRPGTRRGKASQTTSGRKPSQLRAEPRPGRPASAVVPQPPRFTAPSELSPPELPSAWPGRASARWPSGARRPFPAGRAQSGRCHSCTSAPCRRRPR